MYEGEDRDDPVAVVEKEVRIKKPFTFKFSDLKPETRYTAMVNGICKFNVIHRTARFLTKSEKINNFRIMVVSCDRPGTECVTDFDKQSEMIILGSILTTFESSSIFGSSCGSIGNLLEPKNEPLSGNLESVKLSVAKYINLRVARFKKMKTP